MINLIPPRARSMIVKEYWLRVLAVWLFLLGTGCLLVASLLLPTYMLLRNDLVSLRDQVAANAAETANFDTSSAALSTAMKEAELLGAMGTTSSYTKDVARLTSIAGGEVVVRSFSFARVEQTTTITITGVASTRASLATFRDAIEADANFTDAVLPISSLIKDKNLDFTMTLISTTP